MTVLIAGAIAVRVWLIVGYGQAFLGFPDSGLYVSSAEKALFGAPEYANAYQKTAGYPILLRIIHAFKQRSECHDPCAAHPGQERARRTA